MLGRRRPQKFRKGRAAGRYVRRGRRGDGNQAENAGDLWQGSREETRFMQKRRDAMPIGPTTRRLRYATFILRIFFIRRLRAAAFFFLRITLGFS